jgi:hypothetical protein
VISARTPGSNPVRSSGCSAPARATGSAPHTWSRVALLTNFTPLDGSEGCAVRVDATRAARHTRSRRGQPSHEEGMPTPRVAHTPATKPKKKDGADQKMCVLSRRLRWGWPSGRGGEPTPRALGPSSSCRQQGSGLSSRYVRTPDPDTARGATPETCQTLTKYLLNCRCPVVQVCPAQVLMFAN